MTKEKLLNIYDKIYYYLRKFIYILLPIITCVIFLIICKEHSLYPYGNKSVAWCDMNQQVIPLLSDFKDVLEGKQGFTYNLANAGGMSLFGVFFFFLSSPFSFLVVFVEKSDLTAFMNLLIMFKLMVASLTMALYLSKKYKNINVIFIICLSLLYAFSVYSLMYYQNIIWLDIVYLFPLLMMSIDTLLEKDNFIFYMIMITSIVIINYYLSYMVIIFTILYFALNLYVKRKESDIKKKAQLFVVGSLIGALISMISIVPSFIQYLSSARGTSIIESLKNSWFIVHYQTSLPLLFGSVSLLPFLLKKDIDSSRKIKYLLLALLCIPILIDPINKMWHIGSYQSFPCRFAFMNTFLILDIVANNLDEANNEKLKWNHLLGIAIAGFVLISLSNFSQDYIIKKLYDMDQFASTLWGDTTSFEAIARYYCIVLIVAFAIFALYKFKLLDRRLISLAMVGLTLIEINFSSSIYLSVTGRADTNYQEIYSLEDTIQDDSFYRVKMDEKLFDVNALGANNFNTLGHYTSLTDEDYMYTMKSLGYSSYWMEVGPYGGSSFTDAVLLNKYTLHRGRNSDALYYSDNYYFSENKVLPFGLITTSDLSQLETLTIDQRPLMQEQLYDGLFNDNTDLHTLYQPSSFNNVTYIEENNRIKLSTYSSGTITYYVDIKGEQTLYFEAFDVYSNSLEEKINESMTISCNGVKAYSYPNKNKNGTVYLGKFKDQRVLVQISLNQSIELSSFNVFSIDEELLTKQIKNAKNATLEVSSNSIKGSYYSEEEAYLFLPLSFFDGVNAKINNKKVDVLKVFSTFMAIKLNKGENIIKITYSQPGLTIGIISTLIGGALLTLYLIFKKKIIENKKINNICYYLSLSIGTITFVVIYIMPLIINISNQIK